MAGSIEVVPFTAIRYSNWSVRWVEFIKDSLDLKTDLVLDWEHVTCTSWCGDGIEAITGENPFDPWRDAFTTPLGAAKAIRAAGFNTLDDLIATMFQEIPLGRVLGGDIILAPSLASGSRWDADILNDGPNSPTADPSEIMPSGVALADPPVYWAVTEKGLGKGKVFQPGIRAFAVGRSI